MLHVQHQQLRIALESLPRYYNTSDMLHQHRELAYTVLSQNLPSAFDDYSDSDDESEDEHDDDDDDDDEQKSGADQNTDRGEAPKEEEQFEFGLTNTTQPKQASSPIQNCQTKRMKLQVEW
jgi:hypothetical protein